MIPPHTAGLDNSHAINIVQVDASVNVLPDIYVGNLKNSKPVILYLSTGLLGNLQDTDSVMLLQSASLLMSKVMQLLQSKNNSSSMSLFANCNELFGATFVRPLYAIGNQFKQQRPTSIPSNVHLTGETCGDMDCSAAFQLAKEIFEQICPGEVSITLLTLT